MTNAASLLVMSTSNRLGRTVDRTRALARDVEAAGTEASAFLLRSLTRSQRRVLITVRALTALYLAVGAFAAATLSAFLGVVLGEAGGAFIIDASVYATLVTGALAFVAVVIASILLVVESQLAYRLLADDAAQARIEAGQIARPEGL
jgi:hypothetical protein